MPVQYSQGSRPQAVGHRFEVTVGQWNLGAWSKMSGLDVTFDLAEHRIGTDDRYYKYASIPKFSKLKLSRAADNQNTPVVQEWLNYVHQTGGTPEAGAATVFTAAGEPVMTWELQEMFPHKWGITDFDASAGKVVIETLEIVYFGFLQPVALTSGGGTKK